MHYYFYYIIHMNMIHMHNYGVKHFKEMNSNVYVGMTMVKKEQTERQN